MKGMLLTLKKIANSVLALLIVVLSFGFVPAVKAGGGSTLTIGSQTAMFNDVITVPVTAEIFSMQGIQLSINYPETMLTYVGCSSTHVVCATDVAQGTNKILLTWFDAVNFLTLNNENLLSLQFRVISSSTSDAVLSFTPVELINSADANIIESFTFNSGTLTLNPVATLSSIAITTPATKLTYNVGETLDLGGLVVTGTYSDSSTQVETITTSNVSGFNSSVPATDQVLTITVDGQTATYTVDIIAMPDSVAPVITLNGISPMSVTVDNTFTDPSATALDNVDGNLTASIVTVNSVNTAVVGSYTVTYNVSDAAGNPATEVIRVVNVVVADPTPDTTAPIIALNGVTPDIEVGGSYSELGATATDTVDGAFAATPSGSVDTNVIDTYIITYTATDIAGNVATPVTRAVNVVAAPITVVLNSIAITTPATKLSYTVGDALDLTGLVVTGTYSDATTQVETITNANVTGFDSSAPVTGQVLTITVGGKAATYTVDVVAVPPTPDTTVPAITLLGSATVNLTVGDTYTDAGATASDNVDGDITANIITVNPVNTSVKGTYAVTYNVFDAAGNAAVALTRTVIVSEVVVPPVTPQRGGGGGSAIVVLSSPASIGNAASQQTFPIAAAIPIASETAVRTVTPQVLGVRVFSEDVLLRVDQRSIYIVRGRTLHSIPNTEVLRRFANRNRLDVTAEDIVGYEMGNPIPTIQTSYTAHTLIRVNARDIYVVSGRTLHRVPNPRTLWPYRDYTRTEVSKDALIEFAVGDSVPVL